MTEERQLGASEPPAASGEGDQAGQDSGSDSPVAQTMEKAGELTGQAKEMTGQLVAEATDQAKPRLESGKQQAAQTLSSAAEALRRTGAELSDQQGGRLTQLTEGAADQTERMAQFLGSHDLNEIVAEVEQFARRQPALFLGAAFGIGLVGARFLRTSAGSTGSGSGAWSSAAPRLSGKPMGNDVTPAVPGWDGFGQSAPETADGRAPAAPTFGAP